MVTRSQSWSKGHAEYAAFSCVQREELVDKQPAYLQSLQLPTQAKGSRTCVCLHATAWKAKIARNHGTYICVDTNSLLSKPSVIMLSNYYYFFALACWVKHDIYIYIYRISVSRFSDSGSLLKRKSGD